MVKSIHSAKTYIAVTVDVDPDVNLPVKGRTDALSHPVDLDEVRIQSCGQGLVSLFKMMAGLGIKGTFFYEARTADRLQTEIGLNLRAMMYDHEVGCHSFMHEDFLGKDSGIQMSSEQMNEALDKSLVILKDIFGLSMKGFRAPYVRIDDTLARVLVEKGFEYDSSVTKPWNIKSTETDSGSDIFQPYFYFKDITGESMNPGAIIEVPLPEFLLPEEKKLTSYLWPFIEGDLAFDVYGSTLEQICDRPPSNSIIILATHPWHLVETYKNGILDETEHLNLLNRFQSILKTLLNKPNVEFVTISDYLDVWHSIQHGTDLLTVLGKL